MREPNRIKSLDGLRGTFILIVILAHALETIPAFIETHRIASFYVIGIGSLGVRMFFVMSGYLITRLLMIEQEKTGKVSLKEFYLRRAFRIFPTFFLYIFTILILKWTIVPDIFKNYYLVLFATFYFWNYKHFFIGNIDDDKGGWFMGHFWSLSMEEQFYLLWPFAYVKFNKATLIKSVLVLIVAMPLLRAATFALHPPSRLYISSMLHTGGDSILIGCLAALAEQTPGFREKYFKYFQNIPFVIFALLFVFIINPILTWYFQAAYNMTAGMTLNNLSIMYLLYNAMYVPSKVSDLLNTRLISQLGIASYSLYVWQQLFLTTKNDFWINKYPQNIIVAIVVGLSSHYFIEKPILKLKKRFKRVNLP
jgi:peptidoglycan/LPS O-acetylase OafA/YrhL